MYKLLATSALVAAGLWGAMDSASAQQAKPGFPWATSPISVVVGGYHTQVFGFSSNKDNINSAGNIGAGANNKASSTSQQSDSEIWFGGRTTLANGIAIGFDVQLEGNHSGDVIDESYLFIDGAFGRVVMGSENTADYIMNYSAPNVSAAATHGFGNQESSLTNWVQRPTNVVILDTTASGKGSGGGGNALPTGGNDQQRVTYYTPRFSGFQAGVSFTPSVNTSTSATTSYEDLMGPVDKTRARTNVWSGAVNYTNNFSGIVVNAMAGMTFYPSLSNATTAPGNNNIVDTSYGLQLGFGQFLVGGGYRKLDAEGAREDGSAWGAGIT